VWACADETISRACRQAGKCGVNDIEIPVFEKPNLLNSEKITLNNPGLRYVPLPSPPAFTAGHSGSATYLFKKMVKESPNSNKILLQKYFRFNQAFFDNNKSYYLNDEVYF
jgi:hypothetical protein